MSSTSNYENVLLDAIAKASLPILTLEEVKGLIPLRGPDLLSLCRQSPHLEFAMIPMANGPERVLRVRLGSQQFLRLLPTDLDVLRLAYCDVQKGLESTLGRLEREGAVHIEDGCVEQGPNSDALGTSIVEPEPLIEEQDLRVLDHLEDIEEERINYGLYETFVSSNEILRRSQDRDGDRSLDLAQIEDSFRRLIDNGFAMRLGDRYRSRISEIARLLKNVKQRFSTTPTDEAPYLVNSLQVRFRPRQQLRRFPTFRKTLRMILERHPGREELAEAVHAVEQGFSRAIGRTSEEAGLTNVQKRSLKDISQRYLARKGDAFVITGNTGSGKTEAALLPLLIGAAEERLRGIRGCKVLLIYPRQALAKNQLERIVSYAATVNDVLSQRGYASSTLSVGIAFGETPYTEREVAQGGRRGQQIARGRWRQDQERGYVLPYFQDKDDQPVYARQRSSGGRDWILEPTSKEWRFDAFRATREGIQEDPPDILVITTEMLHRWLRDPGFNAFFGSAVGAGHVPFCAPRAVVVDEIHLYDTIHGAQVGMLLRRLEYRLARAMQKFDTHGWRNPLLIGMSATIGDPVRFWKDLSGAKFVRPLTPEEDDFESAMGREYFFFIRPESYSRGKYVGDASAAIQIIMTIAHNMRRRGPSNDQSAKFRSLIFQDSIGKVKKLALEFHDAECNKRLALLRTDSRVDPDIALDSAEFHEGEYWYFDAQDPWQYSERRTLPSHKPAPLTATPQPVYSGTGKTASDLLRKDVIFATTALEVGYDDPSIQFVLQHHAPRNAASFIQKKGRGGRSLSDRPITAVTLSQRSYKDAFYYQNPQLLYDPADYRPPLNVDNHFVQRFQTIALIFDMLAFHSTQIPSRHETLESHLDAIDWALAQPGLARAITHAFENVASESFRGTVNGWPEVWADFKRSLVEADLAYRPLQTTTEDLFTFAPNLPKNLFSTINLPVVQVRSPRSRGSDVDWRMEEEDVALAFSEIAPGKVSRRYGGQRDGKQFLHWRPYSAKVDGRTRHGVVAIERYKHRTGEDGPKRPGPFNPALLKSVDDPEMWGEAWRDLLPVDVRRLYGTEVPERFYRVRYVEMWDFGHIPVNDPKRVKTKYAGSMARDGSIRLRYDPKETVRKQDPEMRTVDPNSNSYPLSFSIAKPRHDVESNDIVSLPPIFRGLVEELEFFYGEVDGKPAQIQAWEVYYGAEAHVRLLPNGNQGSKDRHAGMGHDRIRFISEHDGKPTFYGYDLETEGLRARYDRDRLTEVARRILDDVLQDPAQLSHLQDQYLRFLLKTEAWPLQGVAEPITVYDQRTLADLIATLRAETRALDWRLDKFVERLTDPKGLDELLDLGKRYWQDERSLTDDFRSRVRSSLSTQAARQFLQSQIFPRLTQKSEVLRFLRDTIVHSLKHATRNLFLTEGSTRDEEVGSHTVLDILYGQAPKEPAFYVYERNRGGNGSARAAAETLRRKDVGYRIQRWWDVSLACPVGDEEEFLRTVMRRAGKALLDLQAEYVALPPEDRSNLPEDLEALLKREVGEHAFFNRHESMVKHLGGLLTSQLSLGDHTVERFPLQLELLSIEDELSERFHRPPELQELSGYALHRLEESPDRFPQLERLRRMYQEHSAALEQEANSTEGGIATSWRERLLAQVEHLALASCRGACPACLAARCDLGQIEVTRHTLSRRYLKMAHKLLTAELTREDATCEPTDLRALAGRHGGFVILRREGDADPDYLRRLKDEGFTTVSLIFDYGKLETHTIMQAESD